MLGINVPFARTIVWAISGAMAAMAATPDHAPQRPWPHLS
jgi:hypothetical protein